MLSHGERVDGVERELAAFVAAVGSGPLDARVPTCPAFSVDDLAAHVGQFCGFWTHVLCEATGRAKTPFTADPGGEGRLEWLTQIAENLAAELRATPPDTVTWAWHQSNERAAFVARRCVHELAIHRVDAEAARGTTTPVAADLAVDGIDEIFALLENWDRVEGPGSGKTMHLHGTDHAEAEWLLTLTTDGIQVERTHAKADLALRGPVSDIEMLLYQRPVLGEIDRFGDATVLDAFHQRFTFD